MIVACVYKIEPERRFVIGDVHRLAAGVARHAPPGYRFVCFTDANAGDFNRALVHDVEPLVNGLKGWWSKMEVFDLVDCDLLYLDLDTVIVGDLAPLFLRIESSSGLLLLRGFYRDEWASGIMGWSERFRAWEIHYAFQNDMQNPPKYRLSPRVCGLVTKSGRYRGDQNWIEAHVKREGIPVGFIQDGVPGIYSYKVHIQPNGKELPDDAAVICFHGLPRPVDVKSKPKWLVNAMRL